MIDFAKLRAPFPPDRVSWRVGSTTQDKSKGMALAYIDARDVMGRLDEVCGPDGWECSYLGIGPAKTSCAIAIRCDDRWVSKADGAGDTDFEADKGAFSDAFKRAAVKWGIGRYLYDVSAPWVAIEPMGKSYRIKDHELPKLTALLQTNSKFMKPDQPKSPAGISDMRTKVNAAVGDIAASTDWETLDGWMNQGDTKLLAVKVCRDYPMLWRGTEPGSGLAGCLEIAGGQLLQASEVAAWIAKVEAASQQKKAA